MEMPILELLLKPYIDRIEDLELALADCKKKQVSAFMSEDIKELAIAMAKAQGEIKIAGHNRDNPYFKSSYADLASIVSAARPALSKNGLSVMQDIIQGDDGISMLHTILLHVSGQYIISKMRIIPAKNDIQSFSSQVSYLKRMTFAALVGVVTGDEDDDAELDVATTREVLAKGTALNTNYNPRDNSAEVITREQLDDLEYELVNYPDIAEQVLDGLKIRSLADMPKNKFAISIRRVREIKNARENGK